ncbi:1421_t:CDS:1, partial [Ambispora gerdemannii]
QNKHGVFKNVRWGSSEITKLEKKPSPPSYDGDGKQQQQFKTSLNIDGVINPEMLHAHLALLTKFKGMEQSDEVMDDWYLLRAEQRYLSWINFKF